MSWCIVYLASPIGFDRQHILKTSLTITKRLFPTVDVYIFHEDYTEKEKNDLPAVKEYIQVDFSGFDHVHNPAFGRKGYLMMCRFFSGILQSYPQIRAYSHYMRLDDDSFFLEPYVTEENVQSMLKYDYTYRTIFREYKPQQDLYDFTIAFLRRNGVCPIKILHIQSILRSAKFSTMSGTYYGIAPYNNFHVSSIRLWQHPLIVKYVQEIEAVGGILGRGWLDANIHAMIVFIFKHVIPIRVQTDTSFGYRHNKLCL